MSLSEVLGLSLPHSQSLWFFGLGSVRISCVQDKKIVGGKKPGFFPKRADLQTARKSRVSFPIHFFCPVQKDKLSLSEVLGQALRISEASSTQSLPFVPHSTWPEIFRHDGFRIGAEKKSD